MKIAIPIAEWIGIRTSPAPTSRPRCSRLKLASASARSSPTFESGSLAAPSRSPTARIDCTGAGTEWTCTAGSTRDQVQSAIDAADDEAVITFAAGSYDWSDGRISLNGIDGVTLICETERACAVTHDGDLIYKDDVPAASARLHRISGFALKTTVVSVVMKKTFNASIFTIPSPANAQM